DGIRALTVTGVQTCALPICVACLGLEVQDVAGVRRDSATPQQRSRRAVAQAPLKPNRSRLPGRGRLDPDPIRGSLPGATAHADHALAWTRKWVRRVLQTKLWVTSVSRHQRVRGHTFGQPELPLWPPPITVD